MSKIVSNIFSELKRHAPFTFFGALCGILFLAIFWRLGHSKSQVLFSIFHPAHVVLSAMVTASLFRLHERKKNFLIVLLVGYVGSIGIATTSDCIIPFLGESILGVAVPSHDVIHEDGEVDVEHEHHKHRIHLGFIEEWYIVNPAAVLGILIAFFLPRTKFPHALHVFISTWASLAHMLMNTQKEITALILVGMFVVLFIAVWVPCCVSDIVFPMLFVKSDEKTSNKGNGEE